MMVKIAICIGIFVLTLFIIASCVAIAADENIFSDYAVSALETPTKSPYDSSPDEGSDTPCPVAWKALGLIISAAVVCKVHNARSLLV